MVKRATEENEFLGYRIDFEYRDDYFYALVSGSKDSLEAATNYWARMIEEAKSNGYMKMLVEEDFPNQGTTMDIFKHARELNQMFGPNFYVAHFDRHDEHYSENKFAEQVAFKERLQGRTFQSFEEAENWLLSIDIDDNIE